MNSILYFLFLLSLGYGEKLPCGLVWVETSSGINVPPESVEVSGPGKYVARSTIGSNRDPSIGFLDANFGRATIPSPSENIETTHLAYQVLTNPYGCLLSWVASSHEDVTANPQLTVPTYEGSQKYIGRAEGNKSTLISGEISGNVLRISEDGNVTTIPESDYYVLTSVSDGLQLTVTQFSFLDDPFDGGDDMIGIEQIFNNGDTEVTQTITHTKTIDETTEFSATTDIWKIAANIKVSASLGILGFGISASKSQSSSHTVINQNSILNRNSRVVEVKRTIKVPQYTTIHACSTLSMKKDFSTPWTARAQFTCRGWDAQQIQTHVSNQTGWENKSWTQMGNSITTEIDGVFSGSFGMGTKFFITEAAESSGCMELQKFLSQQRKMLIKNPKLKFNYQEQNKKINEIMRAYQKS